MDDLRGSLSRLKKGIKHRMKGSKRKADKAEAGGREETADASGSISRPEAGVVTALVANKKGMDPASTTRVRVLNRVPPPMRTDRT
jgi:hypothetical protein